MNTRMIITLLALLFTIPVASAQEFNRLALKCTGAITGTASTLGLGSVTGHETASSTELYGGPVVQTDDGDSFQCSFFVPSDYLTSANAEPTLTFFGWVPPDQVCGIGACTLPNDVQWTFKFRLYQDGDLTSGAEAGSQTTNTKLLAGESCGGGFCFEDERMLKFTGDVTDEATDWEVGDLVVVRVERNDGTDDYTKFFEVFVNAVEFVYSTANAP